MLTTNAVSLARRDALKKLRDVFKDKYITLRHERSYKITANEEEED